MVKLPTESNLSSITIDKKISLMATQGKLEITVKIAKLPQARKLDNGIVFDVVCDKITVNIFLQTKRWKKLVDGNDKYPIWEATITGVMDNPTPKGFMLNNAIVQIFEKKIKAEKTITEQVEESDRE